MKSVSKLRHIQESNLRLENRYLMEQPQSGTTFTQPGDPYEYKQEGDFYYTRKKGAPNWIKVTPQAFGNDQQKYNKALEAIKQVISNNNTSTNKINSGVSQLFNSGVGFGSGWSDEYDYEYFR